jgi:hypothetical protein
LSNRARPARGDILITKYGTIGRSETVLAIVSVLDVTVTRRGCLRGPTPLRIGSISLSSKKPQKPEKFFCCASMQMAASRSHGFDETKLDPYPLPLPSV